MLWTICVVLLILWLLGFSLHVGGGLIHLLLVMGLVVLVINLFSGRQSPIRRPLFKPIVDYFSGGRECLLQGIGFNSVWSWPRSRFSFRAAQHRPFRARPTTASATIVPRMRKAEFG